MDIDNSPSKGWHSLEDLQDSMNLMPVMIALVDRQERFLVANREYATRVGKPLEQIIGKSIQDVVGIKLYQQVVQSKIQECLRGHPIEYELDLWGPETGHVITVRYFPRFDDAGEVTGLLMLGLDITHNRRVVQKTTTRMQGDMPISLTGLSGLQHRDMSAIQSDLLQAERMAALGRASALVSHELRNPLGAIAATLKLLSLRNKSDPEMQTIVERLWHNLGRCERLVSSMLDFGKPITIDPQRTQPDLLIEKVLQDMVLPSHVHLDCKLRDSFPIKLDIDLMTRALANLLSNAVESMPPTLDNRSEMRLRIRCHQDSDHLKLEISDTGHGMDRETASRLFEPFFSTKVYGIGIGAVFAHNVITAHQGLIDVDSSLDWGTRILITFPLNEV